MSESTDNSATCNCHTFIQHSPAVEKKKRCQGYVNIHCNGFVILCFVISARLHGFGFKVTCAGQFVIYSITAVFYRNECVISLNISVGIKTQQTPYCP